MRTRVYPNVIPLLVENKYLYVLRGTYIEIWSNKEKRKLFSVSHLLKTHVRISMVSPLLRRIFRLGIYHFVKHNDRFIIFMNKRIYILNTGGKLLREFKLSHGTGPLNVLYHESQVYFGEYYRNSNRKSVKIFRLDIDNEMLDVVYSFKENTVRHIHNIHYFNKSFIVLTGDLDDESFIYRFSSDFTKRQVLFGGSQRFRAVSVLFSDDTLIIPSDTPFEKNFIRRYSITEKKELDKVSIKGSSFHNIAIDNTFFVTTVVEPSKVNRCDYVYIYTSDTGNQWSSLASFKKDKYPRRLHIFTRYPEIRPLNDYWNDNLVLLGRALDICSEGMLLIQMGFDDKQK